VRATALPPCCRAAAGAVERDDARAYLAPLWSHLLALRQRLVAAGLDAAELAADAVRDPKPVALARYMVWKQSLEGRAKNEAVCGTPSCPENRAPSCSAARTTDEPGSDPITPPEVQRD